MSLSKFEHVKVTGISTVVPEKEINIEEWQLMQEPKLP